MYNCDYESPETVATKLEKRNKNCVRNETKVGDIKKSLHRKGAKINFV